MSIQNKSPKAIIYVRCSTNYQTEESGGYSLQTQENKCRAYATLKDLEVLQVFKDEAMSGREIKNRKGIQEAIDFLQEGMTLIVYSISRASRDLVQMIDIVNQIHKKKAHFVSCSENIDTNSAIGTFTFHLFSALSQFESENISQRVKDGMKTRAEKLKKAGKIITKSRFGYQFHKETSEFSLIPEEQEVIKMILKMRKTPTEEKIYTPFADIARKLNEQGIKCRKRKGCEEKWNPTSIKNIIDFEKKLQINKF